MPPTSLFCQVCLWDLHCFDGEAFGGKESGEGVSDAGEVRGADITKTAWRGRRKRSLWRGCGRLRGERSKMWEIQTRRRTVASMIECLFGIPVKCKGLLDAFYFSMVEKQNLKKCKNLGPRRNTLF